MKDTRSVLDAVRMKIPGDAKLLVMYIDHHNRMICSQANLSQKDISDFAVSLQANLMSERVGLRS